MKKPSVSAMTPKTSRRLMVVGISVFFAALVFIALWGFGDFDPTGISADSVTGKAQKIAYCLGFSTLLAVLLGVVSSEFLRDPAEARPENCIRCKKCMEHCPQQIRIPDRLAEIARLAEICRS